MQFSMLNFKLKVKRILGLLIVLFISSMLLVSCGAISKSLYSSIFGSEPEGRKKIQKTENVTIKKLNTKVNSDSSESNPVISPDGQTIYFSRSAGSNLFYFRIFESDFAGGDWDNPREMTNPPNIDDQDFIGSVTSDKQTLVFTYKHVSGRNNNTIAFAKKVNGKWKIVEELNFFKGQYPKLNVKGWGYNIFSGKFDVEAESDHSYPFISADGTKLFFCSNSQSGYGAIDIYLTEKGTDGQWGEPRNLGPNINTKGLELSPFFHPDNKTLYFTSNGHPGIGKMDVYKSIYENGQWSAPVLIGEPISSPEVEMSFSMDAAGEVAYFTSDRNKIADGDIYQTTVSKEVAPVRGAVILSGIVTDGFTNKPLEAEVIIEDLKAQKVIARLQSDFNTGEYFVTLPKDAEYSISIDKPEYTFYSINFEIPANYSQKNMSRNIELYPIKKGTKLVLNNLFFDVNSDKLRDESKLELDRVIKILLVNKSFNVEVGGHSDNVGKAAYNKELSKKRAVSVMNYLIQSGIPSSRLSAEGYGFEKPVASNDTDEGRKQNRRVELIFK
jgi:outer membrane protein OmpA-like peptidoglycan-associated protein